MKADLDKQVLLAREAKLREREEKKIIGARIQSDVASFEQEQALQSKAQRERKITHQSEVTKQIDERKRRLQSAGSTVMATV